MEPTQRVWWGGWGLVCMYVEIVLCLVVGGVIAVLLVPVAIHLLVSRQTHEVPVEVRLDVGLVAGLAGVRASGPLDGWTLRPLLAGLSPPHPRLAVGRTPAPTPPSAEPVQARPAEEAGEPAAGKAARVRRLRRAAGLIVYPGLRLVRSLPGTVTVTQVAVRGHLGCPDPARTGQIWGWLQALRSGEWDRFHIDLTPDFARPYMRGHLDMRARIHLGLLLMLLVRFALQVGWRWGIRRVAALGWWNQSAA